MAKQITVTQSSKCFSVAFVSGKVRTVLVSDDDGPAGVRWWLNAAKYDLRKTLSAFGCQKSQLGEIVEQLATNTDVHVVLDLQA
jgi:hypothetical protein